MCFALFLWYRNNKYDRYLAPWVLTLGIIPLLDYGAVSCANPQVTGFMVYTAIWLQVLILGIGVFLYLQHSEKQIIRELSFWGLSVSCAIFILFFMYNWMSEASWERGIWYLRWYINDEPMLSSWHWLYLLGILMSLVLLWGEFEFGDLRLCSVIVGVLMLFGVILLVYPIEEFVGAWSYLGVAIVFMLWYVPEEI